MSPAPLDPTATNGSDTDSWNCVDVLVEGVSDPDPRPALPPAVLDFLRQERDKLARYQAMRNQQAGEGGPPPSA